jgi:signal transduction histidine kinase
MGTEELRGLALFAALEEEQLLELVQVSEELVADEGQELWAEGQPADTWWVLLDGAINLEKRVGKEQVVVGAMTQAGQWAGGFAAWDPNGSCFATGRAQARSRLLALPARELARMGEEWFGFGVHFIRGLVDTVRRVESTARQREALVALGTLAAGLAHEINNPAAAATRAVDSLTAESEAAAASLMALAARSASAEQLAELDALRRAVRAPDQAPDPLEMADREDELSTWLTDHGVEREWELAPGLAAVGVGTDWCEEVAGVLGPDLLEAGIEWVVHSTSTRSLLTEVKDATVRVSDLVATVRSYSQLDRAEVQRIDVTEGLESTVVMLGHKLKGVAVERDFSTDVPEIEAIPGELNQVWTNLIVNAVDAMDGAGTIRLSTHVDPRGHVVVEVVDTGPGMPPEVRARAFEPFYTTKDVGKGTGLGLDISRRIIEDRHSGEMSIESEPGRTVMRVALPVARGPE